MSSTSNMVELKNTRGLDQGHLCRGLLQEVRPLFSMGLSTKHTSVSSKLFALQYPNRRICSFSNLGKMCHNTKL